MKTKGQEIRNKKQETREKARNKRKSKGLEIRNRKRDNQSFLIQDKRKINAVQRR